jgi:uncharacterized protein (DUF1778 family)
MADTKDSRITIRLPDTGHRLALYASSLAGCSLSDFVRAAVIDAARRRVEAELNVPPAS